MDAATSRFTDRMAALFEQEGQPPIAGRILALLLMSDGPRSLDELSRTLGVSKASASTNARLLAYFGVIARGRRAGDRRDYYAVVPDLFERTMAQRLGQWRRFTEAVGEARRSVPVRSRLVRARLKGYETAFAYMSEAIERSLSRWHRGMSALVVLALLGGCAGTPRVGGVRSVSPAPETPWTPPPEARAPERPADTVRAAGLPPALARRLQRLTLAEIVDLGLRNNPATRLAWANAQTAASTYGAERGALFPTIDGDVTATRVQTAATQGRTSVEQSVLTPSLGLTYLLFDFGGRGGRIAGARQRLIAASFTHNAVIQDAVLEIQVAYFRYLANRALLEAQRTTLEEAQTNLTAAEERRRVGLATVADVLQARTAASQARLDLQRTEGELQTARGALALSLGLPANLALDVDSTAAGAQVAAVADSVDAIIATALEGRPDLAALRAEAEAARSGIGEARAELLPSLGLTAEAARTYATTIPDGANSYSVSLGLRVPIFSGFSRRYELRAAEFAAEAAGARAESLRQQVVFQVFSAYHALQTATRRVGTAEDLVASAAQSNEVALGRYKAGVGSVLDLLAAQSALASARAQRVEARLAWNVSLAQLAHDAGILDPRGGSPLRFTNDTTTVPGR